MLLQSSDWRKTRPPTCWLPHRCTRQISTRCPPPSLHPKWDTWKKSNMYTNKYLLWKFLEWKQLWVEWPQNCWLLHPSVFGGRSPLSRVRIWFHHSVSLSPLHVVGLTDWAAVDSSCQSQSCPLLALYGCLLYVHSSTPPDCGHLLCPPIPWLSAKVLSGSLLGLGVLWSPEEACWLHRAGERRSCQSEQTHLMRTVVLKKVLLKLKF